MKEVSVVLVGVGGYGAKITNVILQNGKEYGLRLAAVVEPNFDSVPTREALEEQKIPHFASLEEFYAQGKADLAILCTPIPFHEEQAALAMRNGSDVLCEKPTAATFAQSERMQKLSEELKKNLNIGFQLSYVPSVLRLKEDIMAGRFGKPLQLSALISWPRNSTYYARSWCAKIKWNGRYVLDSIAMNACAHYLHILFFLLGEKRDASAAPESVEAVLCRANAIETFDTAMLRVRVLGADLQFLATHCGRKRIDPVMRLEFEKATVTIQETDGEDAITVVDREGEVSHYGPIRRELHRKIPYCCAVARGEEVPVCTPKTAFSHLKVVNAITELVPVKEQPDFVVVDDVVTVEGLDADLEKAFETGKMPWEFTDRYGKPTMVDLTNYNGEAWK